MHVLTMLDFLSRNQSPTLILDSFIITKYVGIRYLLKMFEFA